MAYRHFSSLGVDVMPEATDLPQGMTTDSSNAYITAAPAPGPNDLTPMPAAPFMTEPTPSTPLVPLPAMNTAAPSKTLSLSLPIGSETFLGIRWRWWILGGIAVAFYRMNRKEEVTPNARRRKRSRR